MKVKFINVGKFSACWEIECKGKLTHEWLYNQVKGALVSKDIKFNDDKYIYEENKKVGYFEIIQKGEGKNDI